MDRISPEDLQVQEDAAWAEYSTGAADYQEYVESGEDLDPPAQAAPNGKHPILAHLTDAYLAGRLSD